MSKLDPEQLKKVRRIVCHTDADGIASAMILHDALPDASIKFVQYNTPAHLEMLATDGMLFCDFSPHRDRAAEFAEAGAIVLDHHEHQRDVVEMFGNRGVFGENAKLESGAWLAFRHVWLPLQGPPPQPYLDEVEEFALLAAIRDTWQTEHRLWAEACSQAEAINFFGADYLLEILRRVEIVPWLTPDEFTVGELFYERKLEQARKVAVQAVRLGDLRIFPDPSGITSDVAEALREADEGGAIAAGFFYVAEGGGLRIVFSLRALDDETDVGAIAKANGGGGHRAAAGFSLPILRDGKTLNDRNPIELLKCALATWGALPRRL